MAELERFNQAQLNGALTAPEAGLQRSLSNEALSILLAEMDVLIRRYPSQDQEESIEAYQQDLEALALRYSLPQVIEALRELRIRPGQAFFPRPDEVASVLEGWAERDRHQRRMAREAREHQKRVDHFWRIAQERIKADGKFIFNDITYRTLDEVNQALSSYRGTMPRSQA